MKSFLRLIRECRGATAVEYAIIVSMVAMAAVGSMQAIGAKLDSSFNNASSNA